MSGRRIAAGWSNAATRCGSSRDARTSARHPPSSADNRRQPDPSRANAPCCLLLLLTRVTARHDELRRTLVLARFLSLGRLAPWRDRMTAAAGAPTERMIDWIHGLAANVAAPTHPARPSG